MNWADLARVAASRLELAENYAATDEWDAAVGCALVSIAASLYRDVNSPPVTHPSRPRAVDPLDYGIDPPESETERYWREKDEQHT